MARFKLSAGKKERLIARFWTPWWAKVAILTALFLIILRLILPPVATHFFNWYLESKVPGYYGHVESLHFALYRGEYEMDKFLLDKVGSAGKHTPFIKAERIDLSLEWSALFHLRLVGKIKAVDPEVRFTKDRVEPTQVAKDGPILKKIVDFSMPLDINRIEIENGSLRFKDLASIPNIDLAMTHIHLLGLNLRNTVEGDKLLPSTIDVTSNVYGGSMDVKTRLNLLKENPTFDLKAELKNLDLTNLNNFFKAYGGFTIDKGNFSVYAETAAKDGAYKGYLKPIIKDLKVLGPSNKDEGLFTKLWEAVIGAVTWVFTNHKKDQLATKIPFEGTLNKKDVSVVYALFEVLRNAFVEALTPSLDNEINIGTVGKGEEKPGTKLLHKEEGSGKTALEKEKEKGKK